MDEVAISDEAVLGIEFRQPPLGKKNANPTSACSRRPAASRAEILAGGKIEIAGDQARARHERADGLHRSTAHTRHVPRPKTKRLERFAAVRMTGRHIQIVVDRKRHCRKHMRRIDFRKICRNRRLNLSSVRRNPDSRRSIELVQIRQIGGVVRRMVGVSAPEPARSDV